MPLIHLPSVQLDIVTEDTLDATKASLAGTLSGLFDFGTGGDFTIEVDGGAPQTINFEEAGFFLLEYATLAEVVVAINGQITGATASVVSNTILITSDTYGASSSLEITDGTLAIVALLGLGSGTSVSDTGTDAAAAVVLVNRAPEPNETGVPADSTIAFQLASTDGTAPLSSDLTVAIGGVIAWDGAAWQNSFSGSISTPTADVLSVSVIPPTEFTTTEIITVQVTLTTPVFDETYSFTAEDTAPPEIASVQGRDSTTLRVTFTEPIVISSPSNTDDALNPDNYNIERLSRPAVSVSVTSVNQVSDRVVDLTTDIELTYGAPYMLVAANIEDLEQNAIVAPNNTMNFDAYTPPFPNGRRFRLIEFLPDMNRSEDTQQELNVFMSIFQEVLNVLLVSIDKWSDIIDLDFAPEDFLDAMLADMGNPFSEFDLNEIDKRRLLRVLVDIYKLKGTARGIIDVVRFFLGLEVTIEILNEFDGWTLTEEGAASSIGHELSDITEDAPNPAELGPSVAEIYSFVVDYPSGILTDEQRDRITSIAELMKPGHTHLIAVTDATPEETIDHAVLGFSTLGSGVVGESAGTFILHE
jgi:phage tail-like protein